VNLFDRFVLGVFPFLIAGLPILLHAIDKGLEYKFLPFGKEKLRSFMKADHRKVVSAVGETKATFEAVENYFDFEKGCHFVATLLIFNIISLFFAQMELMRHVAYAYLVTMPLISAIAVMLLVFFKRLADGTLKASDVRATKNWERLAIWALAIVLVTELMFQLMSLHTQGSESPEGAGNSQSVSQKTLEGIEARLENAGTTLSIIQKTLEAVETPLSKGEATLSAIPKSLQAINEQLLDMRIAEPVDLSYLMGADCRRVQQALQELAGYKGRIDGICDGATNAAARSWQMQRRRTIAPAQSADEIERKLRTSPDKRVNGQ
jgi:hypothetical protein